jgi:hypothetical protein
MTNIDEKINSLIIFRQFKKINRQKQINMAYRVDGAIIKIGGLELDGHKLLFIGGGDSNLVISRTNVLKLLRGESIESNFFIDNGMMDIKPFNDQMKKVFIDGQLTASNISKSMAQDNANSYFEQND